MVSGRYFLPNAPLLYRKRIPASTVTSVNWIGPEGRGATGPGDEDGAVSGGATTGVSFVEGAGETVVDSAGRVCLQLARKTIAAINTPETTQVFSMNLVSLRTLREFLALFAVRILLFRPANQKHFDRKERCGAQGTQCRK